MRGDVNVIVHTTGPKHEFPLQLVSLVGNRAGTQCVMRTADPDLYPLPCVTNHKPCPLLQLVILVGDLSYSDTYAENGKHLAEDPRVVPTTYEPRWDTWGRFVQPLAAKASRPDLLGAVFV